VATEAAVLVPGQIGNTLHYIQRLDQRFYRISFQPAMHVPVASDLADSPKARIIQNRSGGGRVLVEALQADQAAITILH
jgi:hypothetical protein